MEANKEKEWQWKVAALEKIHRLEQENRELISAIAEHKLVKYGDEARGPLFASDKRLYQRVGLM